MTFQFNIILLEHKKGLKTEIKLVHNKIYKFQITAKINSRECKCLNTLNIHCSTNITTNF